jgi:heterodisulfide reductase subunit A
MACVSACPEGCIGVPQVGRPIPVVDYTSCRRAEGAACSLCEESCSFGAINMSQEQSEDTLDVNAVVIATGYEPADPSEDSELGYKDSPNVISGLEAERQLAEKHVITRPSDGQVPHRIAFVQCVGSRRETASLEPEQTGYCSAVCCAYALRMARLMKYQNDQSEITIFYMDIQDFGRGFDAFYKECRNTMRFVRSRPSEIRPTANGALLVRSTSPAAKVSPQVVEEEFDLVVLAVGIRPSNETIDMAEKTRVPVDEYGFLGFKDVSSLPALQHRGIYAVGACVSPQDIQATMAQADAVSAAIVGPTGAP